MAQGSGVGRAPVAGSGAEGAGSPRSAGEAHLDAPLSAGARADADPASADGSAPCPDEPLSSIRRQPARRRSFAALCLGAVGVVFGDIGTSPLYALREALAHSRPVGPPHLAALGVVSLILWALTLIVTVKYVLVLMRADNNGEGGAVVLMNLAQRALGRPSFSVFLLGILGVSLFYADGVITPAFSVLSAVEGLNGVPHLGNILGPRVALVAGAILLALFL